MGAHQTFAQNPDMTQQARVDDFQARVDYSPDSVYCHRAHNWRYIPIHPFADEPEILERLEISPAACYSVDAYWEIQGDVVFLETICERVANRPAGNYIRTRTGGGNVAHSVLTQPTITRISFEDTMKEFFMSGHLFGAFPDALTQIRSEQDAP